MKFKVNDPKTWQACCQHLVMIGVQDALHGNSPASPSEMARMLLFALDTKASGGTYPWSVGHIKKLRRIYLAAYTGMSHGMKIECDHLTTVRNLP